MNSKTFALGAYLSLRTEQGDLASSPSKGYVGVYEQAALPFIMAGKAPRKSSPAPEKLKSRPVRSLSDMKADKAYPGLYDILLMPAPARMRASTCEIIEQVFNKDTKTARALFNTAAAKDYAVIESHSYDVARTKIGEATGYASRKGIAAPLLEIKKH